MGKNSNTDSGEGFLTSLKAFLNFQGDSFDILDIKRIERVTELREDEFDEEEETIEPKEADDFSHSVLIRFNSFPFEKYYNFNSESEMDKALLDLKTKLERKDIISFI